MANKKEVKKMISDVQDIDFEKTKKVGIGVIIGGIVLMIVLTYFFKWLGLVCGIIVLAVALGLIYHNVAEQQKKMIHTFKSLGYTKEEYVKSFEAMKGNNFLKKMLIDMWDSVPEPEKVYAQKGKAQGVGQSKQNKKKRKYKKK